MRIQGLQAITGDALELHVDNTDQETLNADGLMAFPAVIDPHVHFRTPGMEYKEDWRTAAKAALAGGCTNVFDMPNTIPPTITMDLLQEKKRIIDQQLQEVGIPLRYQLFFGADKHHLTELASLHEEAVGVKVFMGCSTGNLVMDDDESLHAVFSLAAQHNLIVAVHAEDEQMLRERKKKYPGQLDYAMHSVLRDTEVATRAVEKALDLAKQYHTKLYILHVSTAEEINLIKTAKQAGINVFAETTPHHLFFNISAYDHLHGKAVVNPPLRDEHQQEILFSAIKDKIIDTIGSDHAPHTLAEKAKNYGECPSGMPGIEFVLPLLLNAYHQGNLNLKDILSLTSTRAREIFSVPAYEDWVLLDINKTEKAQHTHSKCAWTPYQDMLLKGWPAYTILKGHCYKVGRE